ncbi:MAG: hypothetical protein ACK5LL_16360 [Suipraeoptans sp.]
MINPITAMKMFNNRHAVLENHPKIYPFIKGIFGAGVDKSTKIKISICNPNGAEDSVEFTVEETDEEFFNSLKELLN